MPDRNVVRNRLYRMGLTTTSPVLILTNVWSRLLPSIRISPEEFEEAKRKIEERRAQLRAKWPLERQLEKRGKVQ